MNYLYSVYERAKQSHDNHAVDGYKFNDVSVTVTVYSSDDNTCKTYLSIDDDVVAEFCENTLEVYTDKVHERKAIMQFANWYFS